MKKIYNKLVRDKIPEIIRANGETPITRVLSNDELLKALVNKLKEEAAEFEENPSVEELADIKEVVVALCEALNIHAEELEDVRCQKADKRRRFKKRIFLERTD